MLFARKGEAAFRSSGISLEQTISMQSRVTACLPHLVKDGEAGHTSLSTPIRS